MARCTCSDRICLTYSRRLGLASGERAVRDIGPLTALLRRVRLPGMALWAIFRRPGHLRYPLATYSTTMGMKTSTSYTADAMILGVVGFTVVIIPRIAAPVSANRSSSLAPNIDAIA